MKYLKYFFLSLFLSSCSMFGINSEKEIAYKVIEANGGVEIRKYEKLTLATVSGKKDNGNFMKLFNYISGENEKKQKIKMTTPVLMDKDQNTQKMSFVLPSSFSYETSPKPKNKEVSIENGNNKQFAVITHKGSISDSKIEKIKSKIRDYVLMKGLKKKDDEFHFKLASFNPPWTIPMFRKYEVMLEL